VRGRTPKERGGDRSWGKDSFLPPNSMAPEPPARRREMARKRAKPRHLGVSSPSGNVRGGCRGWTPLDHERKNDRMNEAQYWISVFFVRPEFRQNKKRSKWKIPPQTPPFPFATSEFKNK